MILVWREQIITSLKCLRYLFRTAVSSLLRFTDCTQRMAITCQERLHRIRTRTLVFEFPKVLLSFVAWETMAISALLQFHRTQENTAMSKFKNNKQINKETKKNKTKILPVSICLTDLCGQRNFLFYHMSHSIELPSWYFLPLQDWTTLVMLASGVVLGMNSLENCFLRPSKSIFI